MNPGIRARLTRMAKVLPYLCAIELFLPGGTLIVLGYLLTRRPHVRAAAEGGRAFKVLRDLRGFISATAGAGDSSRWEGDNPQGR